MKTISASNDWIPFSKMIRIPEFSTDSFAIAPNIQIEKIGAGGKAEVFLKDIRFLATGNAELKKILSR